jgi:hypothetical protein
MLHNSRFQFGQGARRLCPVCRCPINIKPVGRPRTFCSDMCRKTESRKGGATTLAAAPNKSLCELPAETASRNPEKSPAISTGQIDPFSTPIVAIGRGLGISNNVTGAIDQHPDADLIRRAIRVELAARWRRSGLR